MIENIFNAETLWWIYFIIGYFIMTFIIKILKFLSKKTKTKVDDKIIDKLEEWHKVNKEKLKR